MQWHDVQFSCAINQPLLAHHWRVHQCLLTSRFIAPSIPWGGSAPGGKMLKQLLTDHNFLNNSPFFIIESSAFNIYAFQKALQTHAAFEVGLSLDQGQGVYSGRSDVVVSSQLRLCHTCIIDVMISSSCKSSIDVIFVWKLLIVSHVTEHTFIFCRATNDRICRESPVACRVSRVTEHGLKRVGVMWA